MAARAVTVAGALAVVTAGFLPWSRSGEAQRNSFELARSAERLDVLTGAAHQAAVAWYLVPALVALLWITATLRWDRAAAGLGAVVGALALAAAALVLRSPLKVEPAVPIAGGAGAVALAGALALGASRGIRGRRT